MGVTLTLFGVITIILITILYYYYHKQKYYFSKKGIPHIEPTFFFGNFGPVVLNDCPLAYQMHMIYNLFPNVKYVGYHEFMNPIIMIRDFELYKTLVIKYFDHFNTRTKYWYKELDPLFANSIFVLHGEKWKNTRSALIPALNGSRMKIMYESMTNCAIEFCNHSMTLLQNNTIEVEIQDLLTRFSNDAIAHALFGISVNSVIDKTNEFYIMADEIAAINPIKALKLIFIRMFPSIFRLFKIHVMSSRSTINFNRIISDVISTRKINNISHNDLLQLLMDKSDSGHPEFQNFDAITAQAFIFFFGGFNTSTTTMVFAIHELANNIHIQNKLYDEIDTVIQNYGDKITYDIIRGMKYLDAVINESLRKYPPATQSDRICTKTFQLPPASPNSPPYIVQPGTSLLIPIYSFHHDPQYFYDPDKFDPERFMNKSRDPPGFSPFGIGPRHCIGDKFAKLLAKVILFHLISRFQLSPSPKTPFVTLRNSFFVMESKNGLWIKMTPRKK